MRDLFILLKTSGSWISISGMVLHRVVLAIFLVTQILSGGYGWASQESVDDLLKDAAAPAARQEIIAGEGSVAQEGALEEKADELTHIYRMTQAKYKFYECIMLAVFALVSLIILMRSMCSKPNCSVTHMVNASGLVFIIFGTLFLVLLADVDQQLNAGVGILGAVAGYLFGTMRKMEPDSKPQ